MNTQRTTSETIVHPVPHFLFQGEAIDFFDSDESGKRGSKDDDIEEDSEEEDEDFDEDLEDDDEGDEDLEDEDFDDDDEGDEKEETDAEDSLERQSKKISYRRGSKVEKILKEE